MVRRFVKNKDVWLLQSDVGEHYSALLAVGEILHRESLTFTGQTETTNLLSHVFGRWGQLWELLGKELEGRQVLIQGILEVLVIPDE